MTAQSWVLLFSRHFHHEWQPLRPFKERPWHNDLPGLNDVPSKPLCGLSHEKVRSLSLSQYASFSFLPLHAVSYSLSVGTPRLRDEMPRKPTRRIFALKVFGGWEAPGGGVSHILDESVHPGVWGKMLHHQYSSPRNDNKKQMGGWWATGLRAAACCSAGTWNNNSGGELRIHPSDL